MYITGLGKQIQEAINHMISPQEPQLQRRRYAIEKFQTWDVYKTF